MGFVMLVRLCVRVLYKYLNTNANIDHMNGSGVGGVGLGRVGEVGVSIFSATTKITRILAHPRVFKFSVLVFSGRSVFLFVVHFLVSFIMNMHTGSPDSGKIIDAVLTLCIFRSQVAGGVLLLISSRIPLTLSSCSSGVVYACSLLFI